MKPLASWMKSHWPSRSFHLPRPEVLLWGLSFLILLAFLWPLAFIAFLLVVY